MRKNETKTRRFACVCTGIYDDAAKCTRSQEEGETEQKISNGNGWKDR